MQKQFTDRDKEILDYIIQYSKLHGFSPSLREISGALYLNKNGVQRHIWKMCELGYLEVTPKIPRSIVVKIAV